MDAAQRLRREERGRTGRLLLPQPDDCLADQTRASFGDALVFGWEGLEGTYGLPDPDDEHVLAAAVLGGTGSIVTDNVKDFPLDKIPNGIQIISAKDFAYETVAMRPDLGLAAVVAISQRTGRNHPANLPRKY